VTPLLLFAAIALAGQAVDVAICHLFVERFLAQTPTLIVFLFLFAATFGLAWKATVWLVDHVLGWQQPADRLRPARRRS
jgi:hypothetical protein